MRESILLAPKGIGQHPTVAERCGGVGVAVPSGKGIGQQSALPGGNVHGGDAALLQVIHDLRAAQRCAEGIGVLGKLRQRAALPGVQIIAVNAGGVVRGKAVLQIQAASLGCRERPVSVLTGQQGVQPEPLCLQAGGFFCREKIGFCAVGTGTAEGIAGIADKIEKFLVSGKDVDGIDKVCLVVGHGKQGVFRGRYAIGVGSQSVGILGIAVDDIGVPQGVAVYQEMPGGQYGTVGRGVLAAGNLAHTVRCGSGIVDFAHTIRPGRHNARCVLPAVIAVCEHMHVPGAGRIGGGFNGGCGGFGGGGCRAWRGGGAARQKQQGR